MIIGIIGAMNEEVEALKAQMTIEGYLTKANMTFVKGTLWGKSVVVVVSGVGKVNAAICTQILIDYFDVKKVINVGVAGGIGIDVEPGDVIVGTSLIQHDFDVSVFGKKLGQIPNIDTYYFESDDSLIELIQDIPLPGDHKLILGVIVTGDQFISDPEKVAFFEEYFDAKATEMEGASVAQVAYLNQIPFLVIRSISDNASTGAAVEFDSFIQTAVGNSLRILERLISRIK